jgi:prepilin-type N-terminal cleavage/methylation domain-containing protein
MKKGFTLVEIMIVVAIIGLLAAIAIPSFMKARTTSQKNACINNLRQIESAKDQYSIEAGRTSGWAFADDAAAFSTLVSQATGYIKSYPSCPASASPCAKGTTDRAQADYNVNAIGSSPSCTVVSAGTDAHVLP